LCFSHVEFRLVEEEIIKTSFDESIRVKLGGDVDYG
jgi:hypothetical protein